MPGEFDEAKHPRADDGKFGEGGGGGAPKTKDPGKAKKAKDGADGAKKLKAAKVAKTAKPAADDPASESPKPNGLTDDDRAKRIEIMRSTNGELSEDRVAAEHKSMDNEQRALAAGHIDEPPSEKFSEYEKLSDDGAKRLADTADELDAARQEANTASKELESLAHEDPDGEDSDSIGVGIEFQDEDDTNSVVRELRKSTEDDSVDDSGPDPVPLDKVDEPEPPDKPEFNKPPPPGEYFDEGDSEADNPQGHADYKAALESHDAEQAEYKAEQERYDSQLEEYKAYREKFAEREAAFRAQAEKTHGAVEKLLERQKAALVAMKDVDKSEDKAHRAAEKENDKHEQSASVADGLSESDAEAAEAAISSLVTFRARQLDHLGSRNNVEDAMSLLKDAIRATTARQKQLAKYLGKKAKAAAEPDEED